MGRTVAPSSHSAIIEIGDFKKVRLGYRHRGRYQEGGRISCISQMIAAGDRLTVAQGNEEACTAAYRKDPTSQNRENLIRARATVDLLARNYREAIRLVRGG